MPAEVQFTNNPGKGSGTCSGGPEFYIDPDSGTETSIVMAVNSNSVAPKCNGHDHQFCTNIPEAQDFMSDYIDYKPN